MKNQLTNPVHIRYYAYTTSPWDTDACGYVDEDSLIDYEARPWYIRWNGDDCVARKGYTLVCTDEGDWYAVRSRDIYTVVWEDDRLQGGYGKDYPAGGIVGTDGYHIDQNINGNRTLLQRGGW